MSGLTTVTRNAENYTTSYACQELVQTNTLLTIDTVYYYDLAYQGDFNATVEVIEANILDQAATTFGMKEKSHCINIPVDTIWLASLSSSPTDVLDSKYRKSHTG